MIYLQWIIFPNLLHGKQCTDVKKWCTAVYKRHRITTTNIYIYLCKTNVEILKWLASMLRILSHTQKSYLDCWISYFSTDFSSLKHFFPFLYYENVSFNLLTQAHLSHTSTWPTDPSKFILTSIVILSFKSVFQWAHPLLKQNLTFHGILDLLQKEFQMFPIQEELHLFPA